MKGLQYGMKITAADAPALAAAIFSRLTVPDWGSLFPPVKKLVSVSSVRAALILLLATIVRDSSYFPTTEPQFQAVTSQLALPSINSGV
jgi:hypothetical protein